MKIGTRLPSLQMIWSGAFLLTVTGFCIASTAQGMSLEAHIRELTGPNAVDCGLHRRMDEEAMMRSLKCVIDAATAGKSSRVVISWLGIDSEGAEGLLSKADGKIMIFYYDSSPCGGGSRCRERFEIRPCMSPTVGMNQGQLSFVCKD